MAEDLEVLPPEHEDEEGGGPVKSFLEHLEDLRWTLLKCALALALGMIVALSASPYIVWFLKWPLVLAQRVRTSPDARVALIVGTNILAKLPASQFPVSGVATNRDAVLRMVPISGSSLGIPGASNLVLSAWVLDPNPPEAATYGMNVDLKTMGPIESFSVAIKIGLYGGVAISAPFVLFFLAQFIVPALHVHERRFVYKAAGFGTLLFFIGVAFCYLILLVVSLSATVSFSNWLGFTADQWRAEEYVSFVCWFLVGMGLAFELPLVLLTLVKVGILDAKKLNQLRMYWVVAGLTLAGFITPDGNPMTMLLMFVPLHALYEISVVIAWFWERKESRQASLESGSGGRS